jgi:alpha-tubulin suppressor-like RCC1 family protein
VAVSGLTRAIAIAAGEAHTCAVLDDGEVQCWGYNSTSQLGDGTTTDSPTPVTVLLSARATGIAAAERYSCAVDDRGSAWCWGDDDSGLLGDGARGRHRRTPVAVTGISQAIAVSSSDTHSCVLLGDGSVQCWGNNECGELGNGTLAGSLLPVQVIGL